MFPSIVPNLDGCVDFNTLELLLKPKMSLVLESIESGFDGNTLSSQVPSFLCRPRKKSRLVRCHKVPWGRPVALTSGGPLSRSVWCHCGGAPTAKHGAPSRGGLLSYRKVIVEKLWREFFSDPSQWWDHRADKVSSKYPDFKHKKTQNALWCADNSNPPWVEAEIGAMAPERLQSSVFSWNVRLQRYVKAGDYERTIRLFHQLRQEGIDPDKFTFISILKACARLRNLAEGRRIHAQIAQTGHESDIYVANCLVDMYAKCGSIHEAWGVFNKMPSRDVVCWNAMILGYVKCGEGQKAQQLFKKMCVEGVEPDKITFVGVLNACASVAALEAGRLVHAQINHRGYESDVFVGNSLLDMYAKCGSIADAQRVFSKMLSRNVVSWTAMILGYVKCGEGQKALELSREMSAEGVEPDPTTFVGVLNACASVPTLEEGKLAHKQITRRGLESNVFVANSLVDMYAKCGSIEDAWEVFNKMPSRDVVSWNAMILGYVKCGKGQKALQLFQQLYVEGIEPNSFTFVGMLNACASVAALEAGELVHEQVVQRGLESDIFVASSLVHMYAKCGRIGDAWKVFKKMPSHNVVSWTAMIMGYGECGEGQKALELFRQMYAEGVEPDPATFVGVLNACASVAALEEGKIVHEQISRRGLESDVFVVNSLVDMYAKCGDLEDAQRVFDKIPTRDVVSWTAMLAGYAMHGRGKLALDHFERMCQEDVEIDGVALICLLMACNHGGLPEEGLRYFESTAEVYNIFPTVRHYACVVDLLGRAGHLHKAEDLIRSMPYKPNATVWMSLLGACRIHGDVEMGERVAKSVLKLEPENASPYVLLSNIYAGASKWNKMQAVHCERLGKCHDAPWWSGETRGCIICS